MKWYLNTIVIEDAAHGDRPLDPFTERFMAEDDECARAIAAENLAAVRTAPAVEGVHSETLEEGSLNPDGSFRSERFLVRIHDDKGCWDYFCPGFSGESFARKFA